MVLERSCDHKIIAHNNDAVHNFTAISFRPECVHAARFIIFRKGLSDQCHFPRNKNRRSPQYQVPGGDSERKRNIQKCLFGGKNIIRAEEKTGEEEEKEYVRIAKD